MPENEIETFRTVALDRGRSRGGPLAADHLGAAAPDVVDHDREDHHRGRTDGLDHLQREGGGGARVEGVAAPFQDTHADGGSDPMGGGDDPECPIDLGAGSEPAGIDEAHDTEGDGGGRGRARAAGRTDARLPSSHPVGNRKKTAGFGKFVRRGRCEQGAC